MTTAFKRYFVRMPNDKDNVVVYCVKDDVVTSTYIWPTDWLEKLDATECFIEQESGVMSAVTHLERGYCCGNGCKRCPYASRGV